MAFSRLALQSKSRLLKLSVDSITAEQVSVSHIPQRMSAAGEADEDAEARRVAVELEGKTDAAPMKVAELLLEVVRSALAAGEEYERDAEKEAREELQHFVKPDDAQRIASTVVSRVSSRSRKRPRAEADGEEDGNKHSIPNNHSPPDAAEPEKRIRTDPAEDAPTAAAPSAAHAPHEGDGVDATTAPSKDPDEQQQEHSAAGVPPPPRPPAGKRRLEPPPRQRSRQREDAPNTRPRRVHSRPGVRAESFGKQRHTGGQTSRRPSAQRTLTVLNLPPELDTHHKARQKMLQFFKKAGWVEGMFVNIARSKAHVRFDSHASAKRAHDMPEALCNNRFVRIVWSNYDMPTYGRSDSGNATASHMHHGGTGVQQEQQQYLHTPAAPQPNNIQTITHPDEGYGAQWRGDGHAYPEQTADPMSWYGTYASMLNGEYMPMPFAGAGYATGAGRGRGRSGRAPAVGRMDMQTTGRGVTKTRLHSSSVTSAAAQSNTSNAEARTSKQDSNAAAETKDLQSVQKELEAKEAEAERIRRLLAQQQQEQHGRAQ